MQKSIQAFVGFLLISNEISGMDSQDLDLDFLDFLELCLYRPRIFLYSSSDLSG